HLKNFALLESTGGDYLLSPAYDLINTRLHVGDTDFALDKGLFVDGFKSDFFKKRSHPGKTDFMELARRLGIPEKRREKLILTFLQKHKSIETLISQSILSQQNKRGYYLLYQTKMNYLMERPST
ncbi:MAG: HipA domain-containing protein, partial [Bacteroidales bacterium]|nr:HipA domain-containing protein [Bacteroidales bacterium]